MKVTIKIDCSDPAEIFAHLRVIKNQLRRKIKRLEKAQPFSRWKTFVVEDNNCYGTHSVRVVDDKGPFIPKAGSIASKILSSCHAASE